MTGIEIARRDTDNHKLTRKWDARRRHSTRARRSRHSIWHSTRARRSIWHNIRARRSIWHNITDQRHHIHWTYLQVRAPGCAMERAV
jgi:hypothetical protein